MQKDPHTARGAMGRILMFFVLGTVYVVGMSVLTMSDVFRHWFRRQPA